MERIQEVQIKYDRILQYLENNQLDGVLLSSVANFAWFTAGGDSHVENHSKIGVASLLITKSKRFLLTNNIEAERIVTEQLKDMDDFFEVVIYDWYDPNGEERAVHKLAKNLKIASDVPKPNTSLLPTDFSSLRFILTESEVARYRWLGRTTAEAFEAGAKAIEPGMTEYEMEALLAKVVMRQGIMPVVILVAGDDRNFLYRHPVPTDQKFTEFAKLVCCARKWGLITALTRSLHVGKIPADMQKKQEAVNFVDSVYYGNTKPGVAIGSIIEAAKKAYAEVGYPHEWQNHHQGGAIGYEAREYIAISESIEQVNVPQAFAWNPSIHGNKSEDTILVTEDGIEVITHTGNWPTIGIEFEGTTFHRPDILTI